MPDPRWHGQPSVRAPRRGDKRVPGTTSPFELYLLDASGALLRAGWDVCIGSTQPTTFAAVEYDVMAGTLLEAKLHVRARAGSASTAISVALFEPWE